MGRGLNYVKIIIENMYVIGMYLCTKLSSLSWFPNNFGR